MCRVSKSTVTVKVLSQQINDPLNWIYQEATRCACKNGSFSSSFGGRKIQKNVWNHAFKYQPPTGYWGSSQSPRIQSLDQGDRARFIIWDPQSVKHGDHVILLGGSSQDFKWLGSPPFTSHETAIWKGNGDLPWLIPTYESWNDSENFHGNGIPIFSGQQNKLPILEGIWSYIHKKHSKDPGFW